MKIILDKKDGKDYGIMPTRAHGTDAGLDIFSPIDFTFWEKINIDTGVHVQIPEGMVGFIKSKSGLNSKYSIMSEGVIDEGYTGSVVISLYNHSGYPISFKRGEKISQLVILPCFIPKKIERVEKFDETERGNRGFGSSG